jgi:hypothetical protein
MAYLPKPDSIAARVCAFFVNHRDEELEERDVADKYGCGRASVYTLLQQSVAAGLLLRTKDEEQTTVYKAGPDLARVEVARVEVALAAPAASAAPKKASGRKPLPPPSEIVIESGIELPPAAPRAQDQYRELFERMQPGDSFGCKAEVARSLLRSAQIYGKPLDKSFTARAVDASSSRIWRTK